MKDREIWIRFHDRFQENPHYKNGFGNHRFTGFLVIRNKNPHPLHLEAERKLDINCLGIGGAGLSSLLKLKLQVTYDETGDIVYNFSSEQIQIKQEKDLIENNGLQKFTNGILKARPEPFTIKRIKLKE